MEYGPFRLPSQRSVVKAAGSSEAAEIQRTIYIILTVFLALSLASSLDNFLFRRMQRWKDDSASRPGTPPPFSEAHGGTQPLERRDRIANGYRGHHIAFVKAFKGEVTFSRCFVC